MGGWGVGGLGGWWCGGVDKIGCVGLKTEGVATIVFQHPGKIQGEGVRLQLIYIATLQVPVVQPNHK